MSVRDLVLQAGTYHDGSFTSVSHVEITFCQYRPYYDMWDLPEILEWVGTSDIGIQDKEW
jgi:hypothetical protein